MLNDAERWPEAKAACEAELDGGRATRPADVRDGQLGPFELFEPLAVAGIGEIWSARRGDGALDPRLAIERGLAGAGRPAVLARSLRQRPGLARLEPRRIAGDIEADFDERGTPWQTMDEVDGRPIRCAAAQRRRDLRALRCAEISGRLRRCRSGEGVILPRGLRSKHSLLSALREACPRCAGAEPYGSAFAGPDAL